MMINVDYHVQFGETSLANGKSPAHLPPCLSRHCPGSSFQIWGPTAPISVGIAGGVSIRKHVDSLDLCSQHCFVAEMNARSMYCISI